ncbi:LAME_0H18074g1_1 [Lachancea meyersii CBS 8951]|uniref:LAME_0H18074g1_1 n=1 Tax=Lachancea meyersii CBS 8951 TaxID=1266667 RepID=A0A1G4KIW5_9SACH|nr:LAME_0H18074g1_1 [Lachancea meyersii CBS 8951]
MNDYNRESQQHHEPLQENQSVLDQVDQYISDHNAGRTSSERHMLDLDFEVGLESRDTGLDTSEHGSAGHDTTHSHHIPFHFALDIPSDATELQETRLVQPGVLFSPVVSPMVVPAPGRHHHYQQNGLPQSQSQSQQPYQQLQQQQQQQKLYHNRNISGSTSNANTPLLRSQACGSLTSVSSSKPQFSPLSSPAIDALDSLAALKRVSSSSSSRGRKTPMSTPALTAITVATSAGHSSSSSAAGNAGSKVVKSSPQLPRRRSGAPGYNRRKSALPANWDEMFALPDSSIPPPSLAAAAPDASFSQGASREHKENVTISRPASSVSSTRTQNSGNSTMPLSSLDLEFENYESQQPQTHDPCSATIANYPKVILPSTSFGNSQLPGRTQPSATGNTIINNGYESFIVASESPVIKAKNPSPPFPPPAISRKTSAGNVNIRATPELNPIRKNSKNSLQDKDNEDMPAQDLDELLGTSGNEQHRKDIHKAAEQGRRNRLNNALTELHALIPTELKGSTLVPSKATTVELACVYIRQLIARGLQPSD